ncbi:MAG: superoxide dismutase [Negativicutes bacterium]|nr:superoxide dismutase [Negativicutes bacterium]
MKQQSVPPGKHKLPPLPYPYYALEPIIGAETIEIHHNQHHKAYIEGLNNAELALSEARKKNDFALIKHWERELAFHGSGHILHSIYWTVMAPPAAGGKPGPHTLREINRYFGNFDAFMAQFINAAVKVEASGWALAVWNPAWERLEILNAEKHQDLTQWGSIPILVLDVWEHAYYLDYQYRRENYVRSWIQLVNWHEVENRLFLAKQGRLPLLMCDYDAE